MDGNLDGELPLYFEKNKNIASQINKIQNSDPNDPENYLKQEALNLAIGRYCASS